MTLRKFSENRKDGDSFNKAALSALLDLIDADRCGEWLFQRMRPGLAGKICPGCAASLSDRVQSTFQQMKKAHCIHCGLQFRAATDTPFYHVRMSPVEITLIAALIETGATDKAIAEVMERGPDTISLWRKKLEGLTLADVAAKP